MQHHFPETTLTINLTALRENYRLLREKSGYAVCAGVVKANAYGLGVVEVTRALYSEGCRHFFVAHLDEALELRPTLSSEAAIYVLHGVGEDQETAFTENHLIPVLSTLSQMKRWREYALKMGAPLPAIVHMDTGMSRLGVNPLSLDVVKVDGLRVLYVMSHLACADMNHALNQKQQELFEEVRVHFTNVPATLANSSGIFLGAEYHYDMVRPGCALYGVNPTPNLENPMQSVVTLTSKILQLRTISKDTTVGYGATHNLPKGSIVATIPVGYADGYLRSLGNKAEAMINGKRVAVVGRVSMDLITLDVTPIPETDLYEGAPVELLNAEITVNELAAHAGTIGYEILTDLGRRYKRVYEG
jgi:alanine racemase